MQHASLLCVTKFYNNRPDIIEMMKQKLPEYIVQCFIMSGFDDIDAVTEMNIGNESGNSIETIEKYVDCHKFENCRSPFQSSETPFHFPPGHIVRIKKFVGEIKAKYSDTASKQKHSMQACKKKTVKQQRCEQTADDDITSVTAEIREKVVHWAKNTYKGRRLKENEDYTIIAKRNASDSRLLSVSVRCGCGKPFIMQRRQTGNRPWLISNFTKHFKQCTISSKKGKGRQENLQSYFTSSPDTKTHNTHQFSNTLFRAPTYLPSYLPSYPSVIPGFPQYPQYNMGLQSILHQVPPQNTPIPPFITCDNWQSSDNLIADTILQPSDTDSNTDDSQSTNFVGVDSQQSSDNPPASQKQPQKFIVTGLDTQQPSDNDSIQSTTSSSTTTINNNFNNNNQSTSSSNAVSNLQGFRQAPPSLREGGANRGNYTSSTDWSRSARMKRKLDAADTDLTQTRITDYLHILDKVQQLLKHNHHLSQLLNASRTLHYEKSDKVSPIINKIIVALEKNSNKAPSQRRHDTQLKKFAVALYILCGLMGYEFIHRNMQQVLPSLRTVQLTVQSNYTHIQEGSFQFDELVNHIKKHQLSKLVSISEDATRIVKRVEYDPTTNCCVGFVLPTNQLGISKLNEFKAESFEGIEKMFQNNTIAKYAYMVIAQPLDEGAPSFCLSCFGTDNKFTGEDVLKRWKYVYDELKKRGITVMNFAADGDSRLLRAMRVSLSMVSVETDNNLNQKLPSFKFPKSINPWLNTDHLPSVTCVQDIVHVGVKLKARLLKPSIILPLGSYMASISHLQILVQSFGKDSHGLRLRDIDPHDKQNFDAVERIVKSSHLLDKIPDAIGTKIYIDVLSSSIYSFLNKEMSPAKRLEEIWYAVIFFRYWRNWILLHPKFNLKNNFITNNAYTCVEVNAHSLLSLVLNLRDQLPGNNKSFLPWILGSQSCEKTFRALRSMTGTFSTIINFNMLGLLRRMHKLQILEKLQSISESDTHGISFPRQEKYGRKKEGSQVYSSFPIEEITDDSIEKIFKAAVKRAKKCMDKLGMTEDLQKAKIWENPPIAKSLKLEQEDDDDSEDENEG